jgi:hypothetical protein
MTPAYKIEIYVYGELIESKEFNKDEIEKAKSYFKVNDSMNCALVVYKNGKKLNYFKAKRILNPTASLY